MLPRWTDHDEATVTASTNHSPTDTGTYAKPSAAFDADAS